MNNLVKKKFSVFPEIKTAEEDKSLQAITLQPKFSLGVVPYSKGNDSITAEYYFHCDRNHLEYLVCEVTVDRQSLKDCTDQGITEFLREVRRVGLEIDKEKQILPDIVKEDKNEPYCFWQMAKLIAGWLSELQSKVV